MKKITAIILTLLLLLTGCGTQGQPATDPVTEPPTEPATQPPTTSVADQDDTASDPSQEVTAPTEPDMTVSFLGSAIETTADGVLVDGTTVTITREGTYTLTGTLDSGMVIIDTTKDEKVHLILADVSITSPTSAAIYVRQADKVFLTTAENSENYLSNGGSFEAIDKNNIDAVVFSKDDLSLGGSGTLTIDSPAGHGIVSKDDLVITSGTYTITTASHGMTGKDSIAISDGTFTIASGKDGIQADNDDDASLGYVYISGGTYEITAAGDGISASSALQIDGGTFTVLSGGGSENGEEHSSEGWGGMGGGPGGGRPGGRSSETTTDTADESTSMKGMKAGTDLTINGGSFTMDCADDAVHSNGNVTITNGVFDIKTGDDGYHAEETLTVSGSTITITESYEGLEALHILVSGGIIRLTATDDGLNAAGGTDQSGMGGRDGAFGGGRPGGWGGMGAGNGSITISGGDLYINASGDGIDANGTLEITGGHTVVVGPNRGDTATLDYDISAVISGGTFIGTGASGMAQTFSDSQNQGVIAVQVGRAEAGTQITLTDSNGNILIDHTPELSFSVVILSSPDMVKGECYTITIGSSSDTFEAS